MIQATQLKRGMCIKHDNDLYRVVETQHKTPGNLRGLVQAKIRSLKTGAIIEHRFRSVDMIERAILDETEMEFLYQDGDMYHFMNNESFEQIGLSAEVLTMAAIKTKAGSERSSNLLISPSSRRNRGDKPASSSHEIRAPICTPSSSSFVPPMQTGLQEA